MRIAPTRKPLSPDTVRRMLAARMTLRQIAGVTGWSRSWVASFIRRYRIENPRSRGKQLADRPEMAVAMIRQLLRHGYRIREIAGLLKRSQSAVYAFCRRAGLLAGDRRQAPARYVCPVPWPVPRPDDDEFKALAADLRQVDLAEILDVSPGTVGMRAARLGVKCRRTAIPSPQETLPP